MPRLSELVRGSTSDAFGLLLYESDTPSWSEAAQLTASPHIGGSSVLFVTPSDGLGTATVSLDDFLAARHSEPALTISADWCVRGVMDGYVVCGCSRVGMVVMECYQYGFLDKCEGVFLDLMLSRFEALGRMARRAWLAVDAVGLSDGEEWANAFRGNGGLPSSATVVMVPVGTFRGEVPGLARVSADLGVEIFARG